MPLVRQRQPRTPNSNILWVIINISGSRNLHKAQDRGNNTRPCREIASNGLHTQASRTSYTSIKQELRVIRIAEPFLLQFEEKRPLQYA